MTKSYTIQVPGKLFIAGEYAVVEAGEPAIIGAVTSYLTLNIEETNEPVSTLWSSQNPDLTVRFTRSLDGLLQASSNEYPLLQTALTLGELYLKAIMPDWTAKSFAIHITSALDDQKSHKKYGLGSSGAVVVAVIKGIFQLYGMSYTDEIIYKLAVLTALQHQKMGSFGDMASNSYGGVIYYQSPDREYLLDQLQTKSLTEIVNTP